MNEKMVKIGERTNDAGIGEGFAIGMTICVVIGIVLSELGGYYNAIFYLLPCGLAVGSIIGFVLKRPKTVTAKTERG